MSDEDLTVVSDSGEDTDNGLSMEELNAMLAKVEVNKNKKAPTPRRRDDSKFVPDIKAMDWGNWSDPNYRTINIRGPNYLDRKNTKRTGNNKVKAGPCLFDIVHLEGFSLEEDDAQWHAAKNKSSYVQKQLRRNPQLNNSNLEAKQRSTKFLVVHFVIPNDPLLTLTVTFKRNNVVSPHFEPLWNKFVNGNKAYRDSVFKFIPNVVEGGFVVKMGVGNKPVILGNRLKQSYHVGKNKNYVEVDVDVTSSKIGSKIFSLVKGYSTDIVLEFFFLLEAQNHSELPEELLGGFRLIHVDTGDMPYR